MEKIKSTLVLEILGRPAEHIKKALIDLTEKLGAEKGVKLLEKTIHEPSPVKDTKDIYTAFAEVSLEFDSLENYLGILFTYMPAHVEITSPASLEITNADLSGLGNKLLARLHDYDAITKKFIHERNFLLDKLRETAPHLFRKKEETSQFEEKAETKQPEDKNQKKKKSNSKKDKQ